MITIIAGGRDATQEEVNAAYKACPWRWEISEVVSGAARGADRAGEVVAGENGILVVKFPADWAQHGKSAGPIRNAKMADYADALIAVWDGKSRGTKNMIDTALRGGLKVFVHRYGGGA